MELNETQQRFIVHWGEKGTRWGFNRTVAQIHALLFLSPRPLDAEEIADTLQVSRSNVSMSIRELEGWGLIRTTQKMGDRRTYYETLESAWEMFRLIKVERQKRELVPTISLLRDMLISDTEDAHLRTRVESLLELFETGLAWSEVMSHLSAQELHQLIEQFGVHGLHKSETPSNGGSRQEQLS